MPPSDVVGVPSDHLRELRARLRDDPAFVSAIRGGEEMADSFEKWGDFKENPSPWNNVTWSDWTDWSACW
jgi:hypothetical protein